MDGCQASEYFSQYHNQICQSVIYLTKYGINQETLIQFILEALGKYLSGLQGGQIMMTTELSQALTIISAVTVACILLSPILVWILPNRAEATSET